MANTGYKQATIAYKVSKPGGEPLDINGELCAISGRKQAIALLQGYTNPNPAKYEVETYYNEKGLISGNATITRDMLSCPIGFISIDKQTIELGSPLEADTFILESSGRWRMVSNPSVYAEIDYKEGPAGKHIIKVTGLAIGRSYITFINELTKQTASVLITVIGYIRVTPERIILDASNLEAVFTIDSSSSWYLVSGPTNLININKAIGEAGITQITAKCVAIGQGYFIFKNKATAQTAVIHITNVLVKPWILEDGTWNMLGFWYNDSSWNFKQ